MVHVDCIMVHVDCIMVHVLSTFYNNALMISTNFLFMYNMEIDSTTLQKESISSLCSSVKKSILNSSVRASIKFSSR